MSRGRDRRHHHRHGFLGSEAGLEDLGQFGRAKGHVSVCLGHGPNAFLEREQGLVDFCPLRAELARVGLGVLPAFAACQIDDAHHANL